MSLETRLANLEAALADHPPVPGGAEAWGDLNPAERMEDFTRWTWPGYQWGWHHKVLCTYLDALVAGRIKRLMVFMPPRHGKSELVSRRLPAYYLGRFPDREVMLATYAAELANRMNRDVQRVIDSDAYRAVFPGTRLAGRGQKDQKAKRTDSLFEIVRMRGSMRTAGIMGGMTGLGFGLGILDDLYKNAEQALSRTIREKVEEEYRSSFVTRQAPDASILITVTRWSHDDLPGVLLREDPDGWEVLNFPAISEEVRGIADERVESGIALWPERFPLVWLEQTRKAVGSFWWDALYQQRPMPEGGLLFRRSWFKRYSRAGDFYYVERGAERPADRIHVDACTVITACDPAASEKTSADETAIVTGALTPTGDLLLLEVESGQWHPAEIPKRLLAHALRHDSAFIGFEANGFQIAVVSAARKLPGMPPIRELDPHGSGKVVRATPAMVMAEAGQVCVPVAGGDSDSWVGPFFDQLERFRGEDERNDKVDAFAYLVRQCPRITGEKAVPDSREIESRLKLTEREAEAPRRGLWGR